MAEKLFTVKGGSGSLDVYADKIKIRREGFMQTIKSDGQSDKEIYIADITGIEFSKAYIQFAEQGFNADNASLLSAPQDANTIHFSRSKRDDFRRAKELIENQRRKINMMNQMQQQSFNDSPDPIDELRNQYAKGQISEEEYRNRLAVLKETE